MVQYSTFTPPQAIGFNGPCNVKCLTVRKITSYIILYFIGARIPKLWDGDIKVNVMLPSPIDLVQGHYMADAIIYIMLCSLNYVCSIST